MSRSNLDPTIQHRADSGLEIRSNPLSMRLPITLGDDGVREQFPHRVFAGPPEDGCRLGIPFGHDSGCIDGDDAIKRRIHNRSIAFLTLQ